MVLILTFFLIGIFIGLVLKKMKIKPQKTVERFTSWSIYLLLLILGISVGVNKNIISKLPDIGANAFIISVLGILFSLLFAGFIYRVFFKHHEK